MVQVIQHPLVAASQLTIEPLGIGHNRAAFVCLDETLTEYIKGSKAVRDAGLRAASVYVCVDENKVVWGYFTLSSSSVDRGSIARAVYGSNWAERSKTRNAVIKRFPYPNVGTTILGRIAIHSLLKGLDFGIPFIAIALKTALEGAHGVAAMAVVLDAKNARVASIYKELGFESFPDNPLSMFILMDTVEQL